MSINKQFADIVFNSLDDVTAGSRCAHLKGQTMPMKWSEIFID